MQFNVADFTSFATLRIAERSSLNFDGKSIPLKPSEMQKLIELPECTEMLVKLFSELNSLLATSRVNAHRLRLTEGWNAVAPKDFLEFVSIKGNQVLVDPKAEDTLTDRFTQYSTPAQDDALAKLKKVSEDLIQIEKSTGLDFSQFRATISSEKVFIKA